MGKFKVEYPGFDYTDGGCCNSSPKKIEINWIPKDTIGILCTTSEAFNSGKYVGSHGDGMPRKVIKSDNGNYYGLGYGYKLVEIN